jgi:ABC-type nitrate/sulfonate/bicarbonate transport system substrate-binding protein
VSDSLDRRAFLRRAIGAAGWGLAVPLFAACAPSAAPGSTAAPAAKPAAPAASPAAPANITKVGYACASINPYHIVAVIGTEKPDLMRKYGVEVDMVIANNSPNSVNALVGGSVSVASVTPESAWPAQAQTPDVQQILGAANGTPYLLLL